MRLIFFLLFYNIFLVRGFFFFVLSGQECVVIGGFFYSVIFLKGEYLVK